MRGVSREFIMDTGAIIIGRKFDGKLFIVFRVLRAAARVGEQIVRHGI